MGAEKVKNLWKAIRNERKAKKITGLFNQFAGREVSLKEEAFGFVYNDLQEEIKPRLRPADELDRTIQDMQRAAHGNGVNLCVDFPGVAAGDTTTIIYPTPPHAFVKELQWAPANFKACVNARVEKSPDGKYRVSEKFSVGPTPHNVKFW